jgi:hypothetical protein
MKYFVRHLSVGLLIFALAGFTAFGKDKTKGATVTFSSDVSVGGSVVKAGDYKVKFNQETGELAVMKGNKVIAKTMARLQDRADKAHDTTMYLKDNQLVGIAFSGDRQEVVVVEGGSTTGSQQ